MVDCRESALGGFFFTMWALLCAIMWGTQWYFYYTVLGETTCCTGFQSSAGYGHGFCAPTSEFTFGGGDDDDAVAWTPGSELDSDQLHAMARVRAHVLIMAL